MRIIAILILSAAAVASAQQQNAGAQWDATYAKQKPGIYGASAFLEHIIKGRKPGRALDIGIGEGRNAFLMASQGWDVTGFDISDVGIKLAQAEAKKRGLNVNAVVADVDAFDYGRAQWDLVAGMYMHEMITRNAAKIIQSLKPQGIVVIEGFHKDFNQRGVSGQTYGHATNELLKVFGELRILFYEEAEASPYWLPVPKPAPIVRFVAIKE